MQMPREQKTTLNKSVELWITHRPRTQVPRRLFSPLRANTLQKDHTEQSSPCPLLSPNNTFCPPQGNDFGYPKDLLRKVHCRIKCVLCNNRARVHKGDAWETRSTWDTKCIILRRKINGVKFQAVHNSLDLINQKLLKRRPCNSYPTPVLEVVSYGAIIRPIKSKEVVESTARRCVVNCLYVNCAIVRCRVRFCVSEACLDCLSRTAAAVCF